MYSFISALRENPDILKSIKEFKRILLKSSEFAGSSVKVAHMKSAYDLGIIDRISNGEMNSPIALTKLENDMENAGIPSEEIGEIKSVYMEIVREIFGMPEESAEVVQSEDTFDNDSQMIDDSVSYINPVLPECGKQIYIPCGFGQTDHGFFVHGIERTRLCEHPYADIYALIYNFLLRNTNLSLADMPEPIRKHSEAEYVDVKSIYRMSIVVLLMIRHNLISGKDVNISCAERGVLADALSLLNYYSAAFCALQKKTIPPLCRGNGKQYSVSLDFQKGKGISVENNTGTHSLARELWYGRKQRYQLTAKDREHVEFFLHAISPFSKFREGQYETLCNMLNTQNHCVCIMPTGSGKSLIFYLASILQPLPIFVVAPTDILIEDQLRNLKAFHRMDNAAHLQITAENVFESFDLTNSLNYLTPSTLQCRNLLLKFRYINNGTTLWNKQEIRIAPGPRAAYVVLDEIHCLSNWGHDFRPEYLMLSQYLNKCLDQISFWGFTATANYTVVEDVQKQLAIPQENFFSPLAFEKYNIDYHFYQANNTDEMYRYLKSITQSLIDRNEKTIVFTKNDQISRKVAEAIGYEADVFTNDAPDAYQLFVDDKCRILVASGELGVGINLPNVTNIIHFGIPLSKNEYVQEIGRAGRANEYVKSYVLFLKNDVENVPAELLSRNLDISRIPELLSGLNNDYADAYRKITNDCPAKEDLLNQLIQRKKQLNYQNRPMYMQTIHQDLGQKERQRLYMLYVTGYINDWYVYGYNVKEHQPEVLIDICNTDTNQYRSDPQKMVQRMRRRLCAYLESMGNDRSSVSGANRAQSEDALIRVYVDWYYVRFLYHHNEQFLDMYEFISSNMQGDRDKITDEIKDYYVLPFVKLKADEDYYLSLTTQEIVERAITGIGAETLSNLERINSSRYSRQIDLMLLFAHFRMNQVFELSRLMRILSTASKAEEQQILGALPRLYGAGKTAARLELLNYIFSGRIPLPYEDFLENAYRHTPKDLIYYGLAAQRVNPYFRKRR